MPWITLVIKGLKRFDSLTLQPEKTLITPPHDKPVRPLAATAPKEHANKPKLQDPPKEPASLAFAPEPALVDNAAPRDGPNSAAL